MIRICICCAVLVTCLACPQFSVIAGEVEIVDAKVNQVSKGRYRFDVTLRHEDKGWQHYANRWQVETSDGKVLGTRVLLHPHVNEQPFTRSLSGISVPVDIKTVTIRAFDSVHGDSEMTVNVEIPR